MPRRNLSPRVHLRTSVAARCKWARIEALQRNKDWLLRVSRGAGALARRVANELIQPLQVVGREPRRRSVVTDVRPSAFANAAISAASPSPLVTSRLNCREQYSPSATSASNARWSTALNRLALRLVVRLRPLRRHRSFSTGWNRPPPK